MSEEKIYKKITLEYVMEEKENPLIFMVDIDLVQHGIEIVGIRMKDTGHDITNYLDQRFIDELAKQAITKLYDEYGPKPEGKLLA